MWAIYLNDDWLGMVVTNEAYERPYWKGRCTPDKRYVMQPIPSGRVPHQSLKREAAR